MQAALPGTRGPLRLAVPPQPPVRPTLPTHREPAERPSANPQQTGGQSGMVQLGPYRLPLPGPNERVMLTLQNGSHTTPLTRTQLLTLPRFKLVTEQAQLKKTFTYQGVLLRTLARALGAEGHDLRIYAENGFVTTIAAADYQASPMLLADLADGQPISILNKGPLTVVMPARDPRFRGKGAYWVWFVSRITAVP